MMRIAGRRAETGFTLIELMVVLLISSVLMLAVLQTFLASKKAYRLDTGLALVQENGRFSMELLGRTIRTAGFHNVPAAALSAAFPVNAPFAAGQVVDGTDNNAVAGDNILDGTDTITVRFLGNDNNPVTGTNSTTDCLGFPVPQGAVAINTFYVMVAAPAGGRLTNELHCTSNINGVVQDAPLADGVDDMQILYGIDTDGDDYKTANEYVNAASVGALWNNVVSVRIALLYNTINPATTYTRRGYTLLDKPTQFFTDTLQRQQFGTTIVLRNLTK